MKNKFILLWSAGVTSTILALPYIFALQRDIIAQTGLSLAQVGLVALVQTALLLAVTVFLGLKLAQYIHLNPAAKNTRRVLTLSIPIGIAVGIIIKFGDSFFLKYIPQIVDTAAQIPFWKVLLVAPYGGVVEELLTRLFLVSLFAWLLGKIFRSAEPAKNNAIMWTSIVAAAVLFGLGHLPVTSTITEITPVVFARAILLNGIGGVVFGWLYWKKGLVYGMVAHSTTDIVLLAVLPALIK